MTLNPNKLMKYCPECGTVTPHRKIKGYYAASSDYEQCLVCQHKTEVPKTNPRNPNKIPIGKIIDDENGIEKLVLIELNHPKVGKYSIWAEPTAKGKKTKAYQEIRRMLGDDWYSNITHSFYSDKTLPKKIQNKIIQELDGLSHFTSA